MTKEQALALRKGDYVASPFDTPAYRIRRVTRDPWINADRSIVRISLGSYQGGEWISPENWLVAPGPEGKFYYDLVTREFRRRGNP